LREPRPSDRVRVRDDLEVSPGSLDVVVFSGNTLLGSVRVDVPAVHHVKGATEVVVLRVYDVTKYLARLPGPEPSRQAIPGSSRTLTRYVRISSTSSSLATFKNFHMSTAYAVTGAPPVLPPPLPPSLPPLPLPPLPPRRPRSLPPRPPRPPPRPRPPPPPPPSD
jgi:hypothetical protein